MATGIRDGATARTRRPRSRPASATRSSGVTRTLENDVRVARRRVAARSRRRSDGLKDRSTVKDRAADVQLQELERVATSNRTLYEQLLQRFNETRDQQGIVAGRRARRRRRPRRRPCRARRHRSCSPPPASPSPSLLGSLLAVCSSVLDRGPAQRARGREGAGPHHARAWCRTVDRLRRNQRPHQYLREKPLSSYAEAIRGVLDRAQAVQPAEPAQGACW